MKPFLIALMCVLFVCHSPVAHSAATITVSEVGPDVVATGSGSLNTTGLNRLSSAAVSGYVAGTANFADWRCNILIGIGTDATGQLFSTYEIGDWTSANPTTVCSTGNYFGTTTDSGDRFGLRYSDFPSVGTAIFTPFNYVSGAPLSGTSTWESQTIAGMGLVPGTYVYTWGSGPDADSITLVIEVGATLFDVTAVVTIGTGDVTCNPPSVSAGESSTCTAVPAAGWRVSGWEGSCAAAGTSETCTLDNIQADQFSTVSFEAVTYSVVATVAAGTGNVSCNPPSVSAGESSTCTAVPDAGWQVSGWTGACAAAGTSETCVLDNIQADQTSTVSFEATPVTTYPIEFTVSGLLEGPTPGESAYSVVLSNNGGEEITVFSDGVYSFPTELLDGAGYDIAVAFQPDNQTCTVTNGSGTVAAAPVTDPAVTCVDNVAPPATVETVPVPVDSRAALVLLSIITMVLGLMALSSRHS